MMTIKQLNNCTYISLEQKYKDVQIGYRLTDMKLSKVRYKAVTMEQQQMLLVFFSLQIRPFSI